MSQIDEAIRRALSPDDMRALDDLSREQPIFVQALGAFQHQERWVAIAGWLGGFGLFAAAVFCVWNFLQAAELREMLIWCSGAGFAAAGVVMIKLWFFMEMQKNSIIREVKRLELQIAALAAVATGKA